MDSIVTLTTILFQNLGIFIIPPLRHFTILGQKNAQNEPDFALFTSSDLDFLTDKLFTEEDFLTEQTSMVSLVLFMSFARVLCNRYDARWISKTKSQNTRKWRNGGIINPLFDGLTYNTSGHATPKISARNIC